MRIVTVALVLAASASGAKAAPAYTFLNFDPPGAIGSFGGGINNAGQAVSNYGDATGVHSAIRDATTGEFTRLEDFNNESVIAEGINNRGQVVGTLGDPSNGGDEGFIYDVATQHYTTFNFPTAIKTYGFTINDAGQVFGNYQNPDYSTGRYILNSNNGTFTSPTSIVYISDDGFTTGYHVTAGGDAQGYLSDAATGADVDVTVPGATDTYPTAVNDDGQVVGLYDTATSLNGFIRDPITGAYLTINDPAADQGSTYAEDINDAGVVSGYYFGADYSPHSFIATPNAEAVVPEPSGLAITCAGLAGLIGCALGRRPRER